MIVAATAVLFVVKALCVKQLMLHSVRCIQHGPETQSDLLCDDPQKSSTYGSHMIEGFKHTA